MIKYYAPKTRLEVEEVEAVVWELVKDRYSDSTIKWANINKHPKTGKFGCILPEDWEELEIDILEVNIKTHDEMKESGWFLIEEIN